MMRTTSVGLAAVGAIVLLLAGAFVHFVRLDAPAWNGVAVGAGLGLLNLAVGWRVSARALRRGMRSAMTTLLGGFVARMVVLCGLVLVFHAVDGVSEVAFALTFMLFFFLYVALEIVLVERTLDGNGRPA